VTPEAFRDALAARALRAHVAIEPHHLASLGNYFELLRHWNRTINLTALPIDPPSEEAMDRLFIEPLAAARVVGPLVSESSAPAWFDLGSGGGSPALPMKIVLPRLALTMVESRSRKVAFLREAARALAVADVAVVHARLEELEERLPLADVITVRAVRLDAGFAAAAARLSRDAAWLGAFQPAADPAPLQGFTVERVDGLTESTWLHLYRRVPRGTI
jgi:16S rRNA (guanine527-N7)-methyltransferase